MDLSHVAAMQNVQFIELDLFSRSAEDLLRRAATGSSEYVIALGMHLCGNLSPRLCALAGRMAVLDALVLCPCCIKGSIGEHVKRHARASLTSSGNLSGDLRY